jgi:YHS domain-containing protein
MMNFITRFLRFVVWVLILSWVFKLIGRLLAWAFQRAMAPEQQDAAAARQEGSSTGWSSGTAQRTLTARQLVRDPVCGMHLAESLAIPYRDGGQLVHFCSAECRDKFASGILRRTANG